MFRHAFPDGGTFSPDIGRRWDRIAPAAASIDWHAARISPVMSATTWTPTVDTASGPVRTPHPAPDPETNALRAWYALQRVTALLALAVAGPLLLALAMLVRATSPGPAIFRQPRPGHGGRTFTALKFRSMRPGSERSTRNGVAAGDPSITAIGRVLRSTKLDELPQLWNVVRGDMVLVGPRPIPMALDETLRGEIPGFSGRYRVRPGLTSLAQVCVHDNLVEERLIEDWSRRWTAERHYIARRSVRYDVLVLVMTVLYVFRRRQP